MSKQPKAISSSTPSSSSADFVVKTRSVRPTRKAKPTTTSLVDGKNRFRFLHNALQAARETETVVVIPPDGSDEDDIDVDCELVDELEEVAGELEVMGASDNEEQMPSETRIWRSHLNPKPILTAPRILTLVETYPLLATLSPVDVFHLYFTQEIADDIATETVRYARQCGDMAFDIQRDDINRFVLLLLYSGYVHLPRQNMYWGRDFDLHLELPSMLMSKSRFKQIKKYLHFCNNDSIDIQANRFAKIQPLIDNLNKVLIQFGIPYRTLGVDEQMVRYAGRHPVKQYMRCKPVKWGYKMWILSDSTGYPYHICPYQGAASSSKSDKPLAYRVVMGMAQVVSQVSDLGAHEMYMDNFFTSLGLLHDLHKANLRASGIIRPNRIENAPLKKESQLKNRGDHDVLCDGVVRLIRLQDSKLVTLATNFDSVQPFHQITRQSKAGQRSINIPHAFSSYNAHMGAVDLTNRFVVDYECSFRGKKWYWPIFINCIAIMRVAAWRLYIHVNNGAPVMDQLAFLRSIVHSLGAQYRIEQPEHGPSGRALPAPRRVHLQEPAGKQGHCCVCKKNCKRQCRRCKILMHDHCSLAYHKDD
jgi:hypothetical protein